MDNNLHKPSLILLDVYETLLDMAEVQRRVNQLLDSKYGYTLWFELFMQYCFAGNCMGQFNEFSSIAGSTLQMAGRKMGRAVTDDDVNHILSLLKHLPLNEGVQEGLSALSNQDFRIAALTNSSEKIVSERMDRTGLISYFEKVLSAGEIQKYKPATEVYLWAAESLHVEPGNILMVSKHSWDISGAAAAGMRTAYITQVREMFYPLSGQPDYKCSNLLELAALLES